MTLEDLERYKSKTKCFYTRKEMDEILNNISQKVVVDTLPDEGQENYLYLIPSIANPGTYEQYIWKNNDWEYLGNVDEAQYTDYVTNPEMDLAFEDLKTINNYSLLGGGNLTILEEELPNKTYDPSNFSGLGRKYLQKNIVDVSGTDKNVLTQAMMNDANTIYVVQYDYDLNGQSIAIPAGCTLLFDGGSVSNGEINLNNCDINNVTDNVIFDDVDFSTTYNKWVNAAWFGFKESNTRSALLAKLCTEFAYIKLPVGIYAMESALSIPSTGNGGVVLNIMGEKYTNALGLKDVTLSFNGTNGIIINKRCLLQGFRVAGQNAKGTFNDNTLAFDGGYTGINAMASCSIDDVTITGFCIGLDLFAGGHVFSNFTNMVITDGGNYGIRCVSRKTGALYKNCVKFDSIYINNIGRKVTEQQTYSTKDKSGIGMYVNGGVNNSYTNFVIEYCSGVGLLMDEPLNQTYYQHPSGSSGTMFGNTFMNFHLEGNKYINAIFHTGKNASTWGYNMVKDFLFSGGVNSTLATDRLYYYDSYEIRTGSMNLDSLLDFNILGFTSLPFYVSNDGCKNYSIFNKYHIHCNYSDTTYNYSPADSAYIISPDTRYFTAPQEYFYNVRGGFYRVCIELSEAVNATTVFLLNIQINGTSKALTFSMQKGWQSWGVDVFLPNSTNTLRLQSGYANSTYLGNRTVKLTKVFFEKAYTLPNITDAAYANMLGVWNSGDRYYIQDIKRWCIWDGSKWVDEAGNKPALARGTTAQRPTSALALSDAGFEYYDTTIKKSIYFTSIQGSSADVGNIKNGQKYVSNTIAANTLIRIRACQIVKSLTSVQLMFCKTNSSTDEGIDIPFVTLDSSGSGNAYTDYFNAPDPAVYPYIYIKTTYAGYTFFYSYPYDIRWIEDDGAVAGVERSGTTANRPSSTDIYTGFQYWDTDLGKMIAWNGSAWVNLDGTALA